MRGCCKLMLMTGGEYLKLSWWESTGIWNWVGDHPQLYYKYLPTKVLAYGHIS